MATNKITIKKILVAILITSLMLTAMSFVITKQSKTYALSNTELTMEEGASVRLDPETNGLKFVSYMTTEDYNELLNANYDSVKFGMLIAPYDYVEQNALIVEKEGKQVINEEKYFWSGYVGDITDKKEIINMDTTKMTAYERNNDDGSYMALHGVLLKVLDENYTREFVGLGYIKTTVNGADEYLFADGNVKENKRSIVYVAQKYLADGNVDNSGAIAGYIDKVTEVDTKYSVEYYLEDANGEFVKNDALTETLTAKINSAVSVSAKDVDGYVFDAENTNNVLSVNNVYANGKTTLKLYYKAVSATEIATASDFMNKLAQDPNGNYILTADIDLSSTDLTKYDDKGSEGAEQIVKVHAQNSVGQVSAYLDTFGGTLNGNGYKIILDNTTSKDSLFNVVGLFNYVSETAVIKNLYVDSNITTYAKLGGAGHMPCTATFVYWNNGLIEDCFIKSTLRLNNPQAGETNRAAIIFQQNGTVKNTLIDFVVYNGTTSNVIDTRGIFIGASGSYENVVAVTSQPRFATNYLAGATSSAATPFSGYAYKNYDYLMAGIGKYFTTNTNGGVTAVKAFENLNEEVFTQNNNQILFFDKVIANYQDVETISNTNDFMDKLSNNPNGYYVLTADIDLTSVSMSLFDDLSDWKNSYGYTADNQLTKGTVYSYLNTFSGILDGNGRKIILNNKSDAKNITDGNRNNIKGLFNEIASGAVIKNVYFDIDLYAYLLVTQISNQSYNALLAGVNRGTIENCYIDGNMTVFGHTNYKGEFTATQLGTYVVGDQQGTIKDTLINYNIYLTRATNFTSPTLLETRAVFSNFPGKASGAVYNNVVIVSQSQTDYFGTYRYADGFRYLDEGTLTNCYMYTSFDNLILGNGISCAKGVEKGTATTIKAFANFTNGLWTSTTQSEVTTLYFNNIAIN